MDPVKYCFVELYINLKSGAKLTLTDPYFESLIEAYNAAPAQTNCGAAEDILRSNTDLSDRLQRWIARAC